MAHAVDIYVGLRLKQRRISMGLSQGEMAAAVGITFQQVQKYERGANRMSASRLYEFSKVLDVPVSYFFEGLEEPESANPATAFAEEAAVFEHEPLGGRGSLEFMRAFQRIRDPKQRKALSAFIRSMADGEPLHEE